MCDGVVLDLRHLDKIAVGSRDGDHLYADIEAGCTVDRALAYLKAHGGFTLPVYGIIGKQTIAGSLATATHGSGRPSMSDYVSSIRVAAYDPHSGEPTIYEWDRGDELRAARCALGCTGIVLSVRMRVEPDFLIEEAGRWFKTIDEVLEQERDYPRQQFYLVPWSWKWFAQRRRPLPRDSRPAPGLMAWFQRLFRRIGVDILLNGIVRVLAAISRRPIGIRGFYRSVFPLFTRFGVHFTDYSSRVLKMRHDFYRHVEMELFVPARHVTRAAAFVEWVLRSCGGEETPLPALLTHENFGLDVESGITVLRGSYLHDYFVTFRRVLRDDTLISMTSDGDADAWYAISLLTYQRNHAPFLRMSRFTAAAMASAFGARPHWGKICPLKGDEIATLYPALPRFRAVCGSVDPNRAFANDFARHMLGLGRD